MTTRTRPPPHPPHEERRSVARREMRKYRDRLLMAAVQFKEGTRRESSLLATIDAVIEEMDDEATFRRGFAMGATVARAVLAVAVREAVAPTNAQQTSAWAACRGARPVKRRRRCRAG